MKHQQSVDSWPKFTGHCWRLIVGSVLAICSQLQKFFYPPSVTFESHNNTVGIAYKFWTPIHVILKIFSNFTINQGHYNHQGIIYTLKNQILTWKLMASERFLLLPPNYGTSSPLKFELVLMLIFLNLSWKHFFFKIHCIRPGEDSSLTPTICCKVSRA